MIGDIRLLPFARTPEGHYPCDGRDLEIGKYPALYALIGNSFGGDGNSHFRIPRITDTPIPGVYWFIHAYDDDFPQFD